MAGPRGGRGYGAGSDRDDAEWMEAPRTLAGGRRGAGVGRGRRRAGPGRSGRPQVAPDHAKKMELGLELFRKDVRALLTDHCVKCHGGASTKAEFDLTTREGLLRGGAERAGRRPGEGRRELPLSAHRPRRRAAHAPEGEEAARRGDRPDRRLDRRRGPLRRAARRQGRRHRREGDRRGRPPVLVLPAAREPGAAEGPRRGLVPHPRRSVHPGPPRSPGARARPARRPPHAHPPGLLRPDRPAADARGGRGLRRRPVARRLRGPDRSAPEQPPLRRALGAALARPGPVRREPRLRAGLRPPVRLPLPRLRDPGPQRRHAVRPVRPAGRSPATRSTPSRPSP